MRKRRRKTRGILDLLPVGRLRLDGNPWADEDMAEIIAAEATRARGGEEFWLCGHGRWREWSGAEKRGGE